MTHRADIIICVRFFITLDLLKQMSFLMRVYEKDERQWKASIPQQPRNTERDSGLGSRWA